MTRDVVRVVVGLEHVLDPNSVETAEPQVGIDVPLGIDHHGNARPLVTEQIGAAREILVDDLAKQHQSNSRTLATPSGVGSRRRGRRPAQ